MEIINYPRSGKSGLRVSPDPCLRHTLNHKDCEACRQALELKHLEKVMSSLGLMEALQVVLRQKEARKLCPATMQSAQGQMNALVKFFGAGMPLNEIHAGSLVAYQEDRLRSACAETINHEMGLLKKTLKKSIVVKDGIKSTLWEPLEEYYRPLQAKEWQRPKVYTPQEEERIFAHAAEDPNLALAEIVFTITRNTSASGSELRYQRLRDLRLQEKIPLVDVRDGTKNDIRPRTIPLNGPALAAYRRAVDRAARLGSHRPDHFLFPFRVNRKLYDPSRPASKAWLRKQYQKLRVRSQVPHIFPHTFRHQFVTEELEKGTPEQTVIALAGWVSRKMIETYSHTRIQAKYEAVKALEKTIPRHAPNHTDFPASNLIIFHRK